MKLFGTILLAALCGTATSQIRLTNPSFEGQPQDASVPTGWMPCTSGSTPDILPGPWGVLQEPSDGATYMGLITREDGSWENVGQRLSFPLKNETCYQFSLDLARSITYSSHNQPLKLRIWAGETRCEKSQLLAETGLISHTIWKTYSFSFTADKQYHYLILEAYFDKSNHRNYKGNILIDACSNIKPCVRAMLD